MKIQTNNRLVAVERDGEVIMTIDPSFVLMQDDHIYICGTADAVNRFYDTYRQGEQENVAIAI